MTSWLGSVAGSSSLGTGSCCAATPTTSWTPPASCPQWETEIPGLFQDGGADGAPPSRPIDTRIVDATSIEEVLPGCKVGVSFAKYRLVRVVYRGGDDLRGVRSVITRKGKLIVRVTVMPSCAGTALAIEPAQVFWLRVPRRGPDAVELETVPGKGYDRRARECMGVP